MKALARLPPAADGLERKLDLLRALWLLRLPESIRAVIPNAEEMDEDTLQQMADHLLDTRATVGRHINAVLSSTATQSWNDDITVLNVAPVRSCQPPVRQHLGSQPHPCQQQPSCSSMACAISMPDLILMPGTARLVAPGQKT
ncbi:hypothetical protein E2C01_101110 [Portunus trituberculatus]|uniref:Uncharacterized protein n=1 Tax=Portunus trituberculatus TaxID=210409 RepID=A0A5B7KDX0_PORTR|nr:hypothetical protein [Portunus trituberculatus]